MGDIRGSHDSRAWGKLPGITSCRICLDLSSDSDDLGGFSI